jgi:hypothetical protein
MFGRMLNLLLLPALVVMALQDRPPKRCAKAARLAMSVDAKRLEKTVRDIVAFGTRHTLSDTKDPKRGIGAARDYLEARLRKAASRSQGRMVVTREAHTVGSRRGRNIEVVNLVATIKGFTDPDRVYVIGGHYDSRNISNGDGERDAPGANDDGSGTAAVVELADLLATVPLRATLRLVCYDGEELGLLGSRADAKQLAEQGVVVDGMLTMDIVGNTEGTDGRRERSYVRVFSYQDTAADSPGRNLARVAADCAHRYLSDFRVRLIFRGDRYGRGGDHRPFAEQGWAAIRFTEPYENYPRQHQNVTEKNGKPYGDLPDYMDFAYLANVTRLALCTFYELATAPAMPAPPRVRGRNFSTTVQIRPGDTPAYLAGWEVVWRGTTAADWQKARFVPKKRATRRGVSVTVEDLLLDDAIVGVRAVSNEGARSRIMSAREASIRRR